MDFTYVLATNFNVTPFEVLKQDKDEVIMLVNYFIEKAEFEDDDTRVADPKPKGKNERIRVNDKTATGGWF